MGPTAIRLGAVFALLSVPQLHAQQPLLNQPAVAPIHLVDSDGAASAAQQTLTPARRVARPQALRAASGGGEDLILDFVSVNIPPEGDGASDIDFSADGSTFVIAHRDSQNLVVFDAATREILRTIDLCGAPNAVALSSDGIHAVTANIFDDSASIVNLVLGEEIDVVEVGAQPGTITITPDGTLALVGNTIDSDISVIDIATATELGRIAGAEYAQLTTFNVFAISYKYPDITVTPDSTTALLPDLFNGLLYFYDIGALSATSIAVQPEPTVLDLSPDGSTAVLAHDSPQTVISVIDVPGQSVSKTIDIGAGTGFFPPIALKPDKTRATVAVSNNVRVVDLVTDSVSCDLFTGSPSTIRSTAGGDIAVIGNFSVSLVDFDAEAIVNNVLDTSTPDYLAISPAGPRGSTAHVIRKEFAEVINTAGAAGFLEGVVPTGPAPEGDKARGVALTSNGSLAVVINNHSHNVTVIDFTTLSPTAAYDVGERPGAVAITPDDSTAVVANLDSTFVSVIDLVAETVTEVPISVRASQVAISPDGQFAYVAVLASGDGVWRINLDTLSVAGSKILTGNMGTIGFVFEQASGMTLSHDGGTLAVCGSFTNDVSIIDTAAWTEVARVPVGAFPVRAAFSPDDGTIYVSNKNDDTVSVLSNAGAASAVTDTIAVAGQPWQLAVHPDGQTLYVAQFADKSIGVVDLDLGLATLSVPLPETNGAGEPVGLHINPEGTQLSVAANGADYHVIETGSLTIMDTINTGLAPFMLAVSDVNGCAYMPSPLGSDGVSRVCTISFGCLDVAACADTDFNGIRDDGCRWFACEFSECLATDIAYADFGGGNGACPPDGTADGNDRFHALNCFSNVSTLGLAGYPCEAQPPAAYNVDAAGLGAPCSPDGVCDGNDAFAALNAFSGTTICSCPNGPAPSAPPPGTPGRRQDHLGRSRPVR